MHFLGTPFGHTAGFWSQVTSKDCVSPNCSQR